MYFFLTIVLLGKIHLDQLLQKLTQFFFSFFKNIVIIFIKISSPSLNSLTFFKILLFKDGRVPKINFYNFFLLEILRTNKIIRQKF